MTLTVPSYIIPGTYLENVRFLDAESEIRGVELLFFMYDAETERLFLEERDAIAQYAGRFSFSVHMPDALVAGHERIVELTHEFADNYVVHEPEADIDGFGGLLTDWRKRYGDRFYLENLIGRDFDAAATRLSDMPVCLDVGHVLCRNESPARFAGRYANRIREIHLHGKGADGKDHQPFGADELWYAELCPFLSAFSGRMNIELFAFGDVRQVVEVLRSRSIVG